MILSIQLLGAILEEGYKVFFIEFEFFGVEVTPFMFIMINTFIGFFADLFSTIVTRGRDIG